ncbi:unnamed protein product [Rhizoctonia solani]|nr:unnamed protein product [Rhizoctonia solani]
MGYINDCNIEFEDKQDLISPPQSPQLAATHTQAIAEKTTLLRAANREVQQPSAVSGNAEPQVNGRAPCVLVPETQDFQPMGSTQQGWTGGALVDRHRRPTHTTSFISRPSAASTSQHRPN